MLDFLNIEHLDDGDIAVEVYGVGNRLGPTERIAANKALLKKVEALSINMEDPSTELSSSVSRKIITCIKKVYEKASALPEWKKYLSTEGFESTKARFNIRLIKLHPAASDKYTVLRLRYSDDNDTIVAFSDIFVEIGKLVLRSFPNLNATCYYEQDDNDESVSQFGELVIQQNPANIK